MTILAKNLTELLAPRGVINDLAKALKVNRRTIERWRDGVTVPTLKQIEAMAAFFKVQAAWLRFNEGPKSLTAKEPAPTEKTMNLEAEVWIEVMGKVYATPFRMSHQRGMGNFRKGRPGEQDCFALQVEGDSMMPLYVPGDYIICRPHQVLLAPYGEGDDDAAYVPYDRISVYNNRDAIVEHDGNTMLKRIHIERKRGPFYDLYMVSLNREYAKVKVRFGDEWRMQAMIIRTEKPEIPE